jgi:tight adherence protein B
MNLALVIALLVMAAVFMFFVALHRWLRWTHEVHERLAESFAAATVEARPARTLAEPLNRQLGKLSFAARTERWLAATGSTLSVAEYWLMQGGAALIGLLAGWAISGYFAGGVLLAVLGWAVPGFLLQRRQARRARQFADQLPDMLTMLVGSLRAGYSLLHACRVIQQEMPEPMAGEFGQMLREIALGYSITEALDHLVERLENEDLELIVTSIHVQHEVGGSLADVLETISETIRERIRILGEIKAMTSQQRMTGWMMTMLPFGLATFMMLINPDYMMDLFKPGWTLAIPIGAVVMIIIGNIVMRMVVKIEV